MFAKVSSDGVALRTAGLRHVVEPGGMTTFASSISPTPGTYCDSAQAADPGNLADLCLRFALAVAYSGESQSLLIGADNSSVGPLADALREHGVDPREFYQPSPQEEMQMEMQQQALAAQPGQPARQNAKAGAGQGKWPGEGGTQGGTRRRRRRGGGSSKPAPGASVKGQEKS